jgi:hypothetical protein
MIFASFALMALAFQTPAQTGQTTLPANTDSHKHKAKETAPLSPNVTYTNEELGLEFDHPRNWKKSKVVVKNKVKFELSDPKSWRPPKSENTTKFLMPLPGADEKGILEIYAAQYNSDPEIWQTSQRDINMQLKRTVLRQWQEEVMAVPLLLTKIQSSDKGVQLITETGIIYSATPRKLVFRVSASPDNFDKADAQWRQVLQSLRTTDGHLPSAEDPNRKLTAVDLSGGVFKRTIWTEPAPTPPPVAKGPVVTEAAAGGKKLQLRTPTGWKVQKNADSSYVLQSPEIAGSVKVSVYSDLDADPAGKALIRSSGQSLEPFTKVIKREEKGPYSARSQAAVLWIMRRGVAGSKPICSFDASGATGDNYWLLTWSGNGPGPDAKERKALENLVDIMSVEQAP